MEIWKSIYGGRYKVSTQGRVVSTNYHRESIERELRQPPDKLGYKRVLIYPDGNGTRLTRSVHRLVAEAFLSNESGKPQINHKNGNPSDNRVENLEWATALENLMHSYEFLGRKNAKGSASKCSKLFILTSPNGEVFAVQGLNQFCKLNGLLQGEMSNVATGRAKSHRRWKCRNASEMDASAVEQGLLKVWGADGSEGQHRRS
jgi:hypothetical protein